MVSFASKSQLEISAGDLPGEPRTLGVGVLKSGTTGDFLPMYTGCMEAFVKFRNVIWN